MRMRKVKETVGHVEHWPFLGITFGFGALDTYTNLPPLQAAGLGVIGKLKMIGILLPLKLKHTRYGSAFRCISAYS